MSTDDRKKPCPAKNAGPDTRARMVQQLLAKTVDDTVQLLQYFRHLLTCTSSPLLEMAIEEVAEKKCLPKFVGFLHNDCLEVQKDAAVVLCNVAFYAAHHIPEIVQAGAVAPMVYLLSSTDIPAQKIAAQGLTNIATLICGRDQALTHGVVTPLLTLLAMDDVHRSASMLLRNLCMEKDAPPSLSYLTPCFPTLSRLVFHSDNGVSDDACFALTSLSKMYGPSLNSTLGPIFLSKLLKLQRMSPERQGFKRLLSQLTQTTMNSSSQLQTDAADGSTKEAEQKSQQSNSIPRAAYHTFVRRRSRSPSPPSSATAMPTKNKTKRLKTNPLATVCITPSKPKTRASSQRLMNITPNHLASHTYRKKDELFRAVEEGDLERVEHLVRQTGPSVTRGARACNLLHVAAAHNQPHVVMFLLDLINPNTVTTHGHTAAHLAAMQGHAQVLRILLGDPLMDPDKRDPSGHSYTHWLGRHLVEAVQKEDLRRVRSMLSVGADANRIRWAMKGPVASDLQDTSVNHQVHAQQHESILRALDTNRRTAGTSKDVTGSVTQNTATLSQLPLGTLQLPIVGSPAEISGKDVFKMNATQRGYVFLLSYSSFKDRPDLHLEGSETDAHNLANVFNNMGYSGHAHFSLTAKQTRQQLAALKDNKMLEQAGCVIFVISSHGASHRHFLTSDIQTIDTQWVLDFFKDSQCPSLKNKPKIFIWNLCRGHLQEKTGRSSSQGDVSCRVDEPLRDVLCLDGNRGGFSWHSSSEDGTPFIGSLCRTLARHAATEELTQLYRHFLQEYAAAAPDAVPQLTNHGFNKKFYFDARKAAANEMKV